jgi:sugar lactone lactonase YvrE
MIETPPNFCSSECAGRVSITIRRLLFFLSLLSGPYAWSHPGPGIVVGRTGEVFFVHPVRHRIMRADTNGNLSVLAQGKDGGKLSVPHHLVLDAQDNLYSVGDRDGVVWRIAPDGQTTQVYPPASELGIRFIGWGGDPFIRDLQGTIYWIHSRPEAYTQILELRSDGRLGILAGGDYGTADGQGAQAKFANLHMGCFALGADGSLYVTDGLTWIRKISSSGAVTTLADSSGVKLKFKGARGLAIDAAGNLYVADSVERRIYKFTAAGSLSRLAGSGESGSRDGALNTASFLEPVGVAAARDGTIYVLDYFNDDPRVRKISPDGLVTTIADTSKTQ